MKAKTIFFLFLVTMMFISCETPLKVTSDYDKSVDFNQYKSFAMISVDQKAQTISQLNVERIIRAIKGEMTKKGFKEEISNPDLKVNAITILTDKKVVTASTDYYGYGGYYRPYAWGGGMGNAYTTYNVSNYTDGSLIIEIIDAKNNKLIWEGVGNKEIDAPLKDPDTQVPIAIAKIMAGFPPGATKQK